MKTTRQQQDATRRQILASAVALMTRQGYDGTTMKDIARAAGIGDATIYKYFPTKDRIVLGYLDEVAQQAIADTLATPCFADYQLQEQLQRLTDAVLERLEPDKAFVAVVREVTRAAPLALLSGPLPGRSALQAAVTGFIRDAQARGELPYPGFEVLAGALYVDFLAAVIAYWMADTSPEGADTTQLVDLALQVGVLVLRSGLPHRLLELGGFVLRSQMVRLLQPGGNLLGLLQGARQHFGGMAAAFAARQAAAPAATASPPPPPPAPAARPRRRAAPAPATPPTADAADTAAPHARRTRSRKTAP